MTMGTTMETYLQVGHSTCTKVRVILDRTHGNMITKVVLYKRKLLLLNFGLDKKAYHNNFL